MNRRTGEGLNSFKILCLCEGRGFQPLATTGTATATIKPHLPPTTREESHKSQTHLPPPGIIRIKQPMYETDFSILLKNYPMIAEGILTTISVSLLASVLAFALGSFFAYFRTSPLKPVSKVTDFIVLSIRNMPLLILIYLFYKGLPSIHVVWSAYTCGVLALGLYSGCYISDAVISGINAVPKEHFQASKALGLNRFKSFIYVIYPQALRYCVPVLGNQFMSLVKNSSLVSFIAVTDIFYVVFKGISDTYRIYEYFTLAVAVYLVLTGFVLLTVKTLQKIYSIPSPEVVI